MVFRFHWMYLEDGGSILKCHSLPYTANHILTIVYTAEVKLSDVNLKRVRGGTSIFIGGCFQTLRTTSLEWEFFVGWATGG